MIQCGYHIPEIIVVQRLISKLIWKLNIKLTNKNAILKKKKQKRLTCIIS